MSELSPSEIAEIRESQSYVGQFPGARDHLLVTVERIVSARESAVLARVKAVADGLREKSQTLALAPESSLAFRRAWESAARDLRTLIADLGGTDD